MPDDDDLSDHDYASIYGHDALDARHRARHAAQMALLDALLVKSEARIAALQQMRATSTARRDRDNGP
jgi:alpha-D-ribose 1-methylphosphonate 5-triphosphate synthase subunit PhnG